MNNHNFWCENCAKKLFFENIDHLNSIIKQKLQKKLPFIEIETQKKMHQSFEDRVKLYKCPTCGHILKEINK